MEKKMDEIKGKFLRGEKLEIGLYDIHAHLGGYSGAHPVFDGETEEIVEEMERIGIEKAFVFPLSAYGAEWYYQNNKLISDCKKYNNKFYGFSSVNLNCSEEEITKELNRCRKEGTIGIKILAGYQGYPEDGAMVEFVCEYANHYKMPILNHSWGSALFLEKMVKKYPDVFYICGHFSFGWAEVVNNYENVWLCTCNYLDYGSIEKMVKEIRNDRICWGSDFSDLHFGFTLGPILLSDIPDEVKKKILRENTKSLIDKFPNEKS